MPKLSLQRIPFTVDADNRLRMLKGRTGITPNILCRMGFCLSLAEAGTPIPPSPDAKPGREINRYTLLGEYDTAFLALLAARLSRDEEPCDELDSSFVAHMNRGVDLLSARVRTLSDIGELV